MIVLAASARLAVPSRETAPDGNLARSVRRRNPDHRRRHSSGPSRHDAGERVEVLSFWNTGDEDLLRQGSPMASSTTLCRPVARRDGRTRAASKAFLAAVPEPEVAVVSRSAHPGSRGPWTSSAAAETTHLSRGMASPARASAAARSNRRFRCRARRRRRCCGLPFSPTGRRAGPYAPASPRLPTERNRNVSSCRPRARTRGRYHRARLTPLRGTAMVRWSTLTAG